MLRRTACPWIALIAAAASLLASGWVMAAGAPPSITLDFDHLTTGYELDGVHRDLPCESCHLNAVFKGTPTDCGSCHITGSPFNATAKTATHIPSTNNCAACHNTFSFRPDVHFDHAEVLGSCESCHNGTIAQGEGPTHPMTSQDCAACHTVMSWNPTKTVDHSQIPLAVAGFCIVCHNGVQAAGQNPGHLATTLECGDCHLTTTWLGATFNHTGITTGCVSCHNGTKAVGKQGNHMPTSNLCENCHTTGIGTAAPAWAPSLFDHTQMTVTTCQSCHSGAVKISTGFVSGQPVNHVPPIPSTVDCGVCHGNVPTAETWTVLAASIPVLHSGLNVSNCLLCHAGETFAGVPAPYIPMSVSGVSPTKATPLAPPHIPILAGADCSSCHAAAYLAGGFGPATAMSAAKHAFVSVACNTCHEAGLSFYTGSGTALQTRPADHTAPNMAAPNDCSNCHETADWNSTMFPVGHMPNPGNQACNVCHTALPGNYTTLASNAVLHTGISGGCSQCHGASAALTFYKNFTPKSAVLTPAHIPYLAGTECNACHSTANYAVGGFSAMVMTAATHAFVAATCDLCHEAGLSFYPGAALNLQGRPADHLSSSNPQEVSGDCTGCHTTASWATTVLPGGHMPNPANQTCVTCHTAAPTDYTPATLATNAVLHTGISGNCALCHGSTTTTLTFYNNYPVKSALLSPVHIPVLATADCSACHSSTTYAVGGFSGTTMSAAKHAFVATTCDTCHEAGLSFYPGAALNLQGRPANHTPANQAAPNDCSGCHETTDWNSTLLPSGHMPNPGNQSCNVCHTAAPSNYTTLAANPVLHTGIASGCNTCHGSTAALTFYNNFTPKSAVLTPSHIPWLSPTTPCEDCHSATVFTAFSGTTMSAATHAFVATTCDTCHEAGLSFYPGAALNLQGRPNSGTFNHLTSSDPNQVSGDCSLCHNVTDWASNVPPVGHMPNPANNACATCHTTPSSTPGTPDYTQYSIAGVHTGSIVGSCDICHSGASWIGSPARIMPKPSSGLTPAHIPVIAGTDCSACHITTGIAVGGFANTMMSAAKHAFVATTCDTCHEAGLSFYPGAALNLQGRPADHTSANQAAPNDCSGCHETTDWNSNTLPAGHMPNPGNQACSVCHTAAPSNYTTLAANPVLHTGITSGCITCHGSTAALTFYNNFTPKSAVLTPAHIPWLTSNTPCEDCHSTSSFAVGGFGPITMTQATHAFVAATCDTCHEAGVVFYMGSSTPALQGRPADHTSGQMVAPNQCSLCHTTANWNSTAMPAGHMPNPASQACSVCHTTAPADYSTTTLAANAILHTGISSGCITCHGGPAGALTFYNNFTPKSAVLSPVHIPTSTTPCEDCHTATVFTAFSGTTMTSAKHTSMFTVIGKSCDACHNAVTPPLSFYGVNNLTTRPGNHSSGSKLTNDCSSCHSPNNWDDASQQKAVGAAKPVVRSVIGTVATVPVLPATGPTLLAPARGPATPFRSISHAGVTESCVSCHNGMLATGKGPNHIASNSQCENCHTTVAWLPARFDHRGVNSPCVSCHNGVVASGKTLQHMVTSQDCGACHSTIAWLPVRFSHQGINGTCQSCHNGLTASGKPLQHVATTLDCASCHNTQTWSVIAPPPVMTRPGLAPPRGATVQPVK